MAITVHHLNCGTLRLPTAPMVCHVLLLETPGGLVLVDTGFGLADIAQPAKRIGPFRHVIRPRLDPAETAIRQVARVGFDPGEVRHRHASAFRPASARHFQVTNSQSPCMSIAIPFGFKRFRTSAQTSTVDAAHPECCKNATFSGDFFMLRNR